MGLISNVRARTTTTALLAIMAAAATALADPIVMWDGAAEGYQFDVLTKTVGGKTFTLNLNPANNPAPNTVAADFSYVLIGNADSQSGITLTVQSQDASQPNTFGDDITVIVKCRDMPVSAGSNRAIITLMDGNKYKYGGTSNPDNGAVLGVYNSAGTSGWIWKGSIANYATVTGAFTNGHQVVAFTYSHNNEDGGSIYYVNGSQIQTNPSLKANELDSGLNGRILGISLGGVDVATGSQFYAMKGMKIDAIAVFNSKLSAEEVAAFRFPSKWVSEINVEFGNQQEIELEMPDGTSVIGDTTFNATKVNFKCNGSITVVPPAGNAAEFDFSQVTGDATIKYSGSLPAVSGDKFTSTTVPAWVTDGTQWTDAIFISNLTPNTTATRAPLYPFNLQSYGNANSTVKLSAVGSATSNTAYLPATNIESKVVLVDGDSPALRLSDGISDTCTAFRELAGNGTFIQINPIIFQGITINVMTNFTGTICPSNMIVTFGTAKRTGRTGGASNNQDTMRRLYIDPDAILSLPAGFPLWNPATVVIDGPVDFKTSETVIPDGFVLLSNIGSQTTVTGNASFTINGEPVERFMCKVKVVGTTLQAKKTLGKRVIFR